MNRSDLDRNAYMLCGPLAKRGYLRWWHSFTGTSLATGEVRTFFVEYLILNPVPGKKKKGEAAVPSYVRVSGGAFPTDEAPGLQICDYFPIRVAKFAKKPLYFQVDDNTYWSGDPDRQYNQMVDIREVPELVMDDSEHIVDYEYQYQYCLNISFNEECTPGRGSAIFLHCFGPLKPYTGGCVAIPENLMKQVMQTVREDCVVVIDTLENLGGSF